MQQASSWQRLIAAGFLIFGTAALAPLASSQSDFNETLTTLEQWVETERKIAVEESEWETERQTLQNLLSLYQDELASLDKVIEDSAADVSAADAARAQLTTQSDRLGEIEKSVATVLASAEVRLKTLYPRLPLPLQSELSPLFAQLPEDSSDTTLSLGQRVQFIAGMLTQIQKFNTAVTVTEELRDFGGEGQIQIDAIYFGLGTAYFVDKSNAYAGYAVLEESGWTWREDSSLAPLVRQALDVYGSPGKAAFVQLPVEIK